MDILGGRLVILASLPLTIVSSQLMPLGNFLKHPGEFLNGHLMKTITANRIDCSMACANLFGCRSVNIYKYINGTEMCELNDSSKSSAHPGSMVSRTGYDHYELTSRNGCSTEICLGSKEWKIFNSSQFRLFEDRVTWGEARHKCRALKGDLVSIHSQQEQDFISTNLLNNAPRGNSTNTKLMMLLKLDGISDAGLSLHGAATFKDVDGYKALYLDGNSQNYATTQPISIEHRGFTLGAWVKLLTPASEGLINGDWSAPFQFALKIGKEGKVHFKLMFDSTNTTTLTSNRSLTFNVWTHVLASWSNEGAERLTMAIFINGKQEASEAFNMNSSTLMSTNHQYDIGLDRNSSKVLHAYIRELTAFNWPIRKSKMVEERIGRFNKRDAVWTGLNDLSKEETFTFSDESHLSFSFWSKGFPKNLYMTSDCVAFSLESGLNHKWIDGPCGLELPYICRRKMN